MRVRALTNSRMIFRVLTNSSSSGLDCAFGSPGRYRHDGWCEYLTRSRAKLWQKLAGMSSASRCASCDTFAATNGCIRALVIHMQMSNRARQRTSRGEGGALHSTFAGQFCGDNADSNEREAGLGATGVSDRMYSTSIDLIIDRPPL